MAPRTTATNARRRWREWRRRDLNQDLIDELAELFRSGATVKIAAGKVGIPAGVIRMWLFEGEKQLDAIYRAGSGYPDEEGLLYAECAKATAEYLQGRIEKIEGAGVEYDENGKPIFRPEWRAQSWLLERRDEDFNPASKVDVQTHTTVEVVQHDDAIVAAKLAELGFLIPVQGSKPELLPALSDGAPAGGAGATVGLSGPGEAG